MRLSISAFCRLYVFIFLLLAPRSFAQQFAPPLEGLKSYGCDAQGYDTGAWIVHVWADYADGRRQGEAAHGWIALYAIRTGKQAAKKATADCGEWVSEIKRRIEKASRESKQK